MTLSNKFIFTAIKNRVEQLTLAGLEIESAWRQAVGEIEDDVQRVKATMGFNIERAGDDRHWFKRLRERGAA